MEALLTCQECGAQLPADSRFCEVCGSQLALGTDRLGDGSPTQSKNQPKPARPEALKKETNWGRVRGPALIVAGLLAVAAVAAVAFVLLDEKSALDDSRQELADIRVANEESQAALREHDAEIARQEAALRRAEGTNAKLGKKIAKLTDGDVATSSNGIVATDPQQAVDILHTAWLDDNLDAALAVADQSVSDELFGVPLVERDDYDFHQPSCEDKADGSAVCTFQYYACCPALLIFEWRGADGYVAASISNPAD